MGYDLGRAVLAACSVLAILIAASAFPVAGFGTLPGTGDAGPGAGAGPGGDGPPPAGEEVTASPGDPGDGTTDESTDPDDDGGSGDGTTTAAGDGGATETPTTTEAGGDPSGDRDGGSGLGLVAALLTVLGWLLAAFALVSFLAVGVVGLGMAVGVVVVERTAGALIVHLGGYEFRVGRVFQGTSRTTMSYVLALSAATTRLVEDFGAALSRATSGIGPALSALGTAAGVAVAGVPRAVGAGLAGVTRAAGTGLLALPSGLGAIADGLGGFGGGGSTPDRDARDAAAVPPSDPDDGPSAPASIEEAWRRFVDLLAVRDDRTKTPAEIARIAVDGGLPAGPVERLTRAFQEVRYGNAADSEDRLQAVLSALEEIRSGGEES